MIPALSEAESVSTSRPSSDTSKGSLRQQYHQTTCNLRNPTPYSLYPEHILGNVLVVILEYRVPNPYSTEEQKPPLSQKGKSAKAPCPGSSPGLRVVQVGLVVERVFRLGRFFLVKFRSVWLSLNPKP